MANVLGLALKITGDASGLRLDPAQRALQRLGDETDKVAAIFDKFTGDSEAAVRAQAEFERQSRELLNTLRDGGSATEFAANFERIAEAARAEAAALQEAARITESVRTPLERFGQSAGELASQLEAGRISQQTYNRVLEQSTRGFTDAELAASGLAAVDLERLQSLRASAASEAERVAALQRGAQITASLQTDEEKRAARLAELDNLLTTGAISEETYTRAVEQASGVQEAAARAEQERQRVLQEGQRITDRFATTEERRGQELANLQRLLDAGAISEETFARASAEASGANEAAARAERERADALAAASRIIQANLTPLERYDAQLIELQGHLEAGRLTQEQFNRASAQAASGLSAAERASRGLAVETEAIGDAAAAATLQFNELSGIFAILPGPLGNIAGRISGIASASEGLSRIFSGGLRQGIATISASFTSLVTPVNLAIGAMAAIGAAVPSILRAVSAASDLGEEASKSSVIFGDAAASVSEFARSASAIGLAETQALRATGTFGNLFSAIGLTQTQSAEFAVELTRLASDLASFNNTTTDDAIQALGAALRGESEPIRRYGVLLNDATLRQIALEEGIVDTVRQLEPAERAQAAYAAILRQTTTAQGDFLRTSNSLPNLQRQISAAFQNASVTLGRQLEPAFRAFAQIAQSLSPVLTAVLESLSPITAVVSALAQAVSAILVPLADLISTVLTPLSRVLLPAIAAQVIFLNRQILVGAIGSFAQGFTAAATAAGSYSVAARAASAATLTLSGSIRTLLSSTGVGAAVVLVGLAAERLISYVFAAEDAAGKSQDLAGSADDASASVTRLAGAFANLNTTQVAALQANLKDVNSILSTSRATVQALAGEFSQRAFGAADILRREVARLQQQLEQASSAAERSRIIGAIEGATRRYQEQIDIIRRAAAERDQQINKERQVADQLLEQLRIEEQFGGNTARARAADAVLAINREIIRTEASIDEVRRLEGERGAAQAQQRIADLRRALEVQQQIASGFTEQAEADRERIRQLLGATQQRSDAELNILALQREQQRILDEQSAAVFRGGDAFERTIAATQSQLDQIGDALREQEDLRDAQSLGFIEGFDAAFQAANESIDRLTDTAAEFGRAGVDAAARLQEGIAAAQEQARDGILNREAFEAEVARRQRLFEQEIEQVRQVADERQRVNEFVDQQFLLARFGGDQQRLDAANRAAEIEREIIRVQQDVQAARAAGDQAAVNAGIQRLGLLDQVGARERDIATGRQQFEEQIAQQREQYLQQIAEQQKQAEEQQKKFAEERAKAVEAENQRQQARLRELNTLGSGVIEGNDIRTAEGAALFLQLAANRQDPALIEARLQTRRLTEIRQEVRALVEGLTGLPVLNIAGGAG